MGSPVQRGRRDGTEEQIPLALFLGRGVSDRDRLTEGAGEAHKYQRTITHALHTFRAGGDDAADVVGKEWVLAYIVGSVRRRSAINNSHHRLDSTRARFDNQNLVRIYLSTFPLAFRMLIAVAPWAGSPELTIRK